MSFATEDDNDQALVFMMWFYLKTLKHGDIYLMELKFLQTW
ncbi:hypothetical protein [Morganella morganii]|nr:hypothetical protein [Morganella morganii]